MSIHLANKGFFSRDIKYDSASCRNFLDLHTRCFIDMSANITTYANDVRVSRLGLNLVQEAKARQFVEAECKEYEKALSDLLSTFREITGYSVGFFGENRSYLGLYYCAPIKDHKIHALDHNEDFLLWEVGPLVERVRLVQFFDKLCDEIRDIFIWYSEHTEIVDVEEIITIHKMVAELNGNVSPF